VLRSGVRRHGDPALEGQQGRDVDDRAAPGGKHRGAERLGEEEDRVEVDVHHRVPVVEGHLGCGRAPDGAAVVDKDVDGSVLDEHLGGGYDRLPVTQVRRHGADTSPARLRLGRDVVTVSRGAAPEDEVGAR